MMVLIDQDRGENPYVEVTMKLTFADIQRLSPDLQQRLYTADTQIVLDTLPVAHLALNGKDAAPAARPITMEDTSAAPWD